MARKTKARVKKKTKAKRHYVKKYCVGIRIEMPSRWVKENLAEQYKTYFDSKDVSNVCLKSKVMPECVKDLVLTSSVVDEGNTSCFSVLINLKEDKDNAVRIVKIINILGDGKLMRERVKDFMDKKSQLCLIPELAGLFQVFQNLNQILPRFIEVAWLNAPDAKLR